MTVGCHWQQRSDLHQDVITPSQVSRRAAPAITAWCLDQSGAHGVELHVPRRGQEVVFIDDERGEAALPQVPSPALPQVDPPRVPAMCLADGATQALGGLRDNDKVNMIGHQAICPDRDLLCAAELGHELEVVLVVFLTEECLLSAVAPLGDMVRHARSYHTSQSSHGGKLTRPQPPRQELGMVSPEPYPGTLPGTPSRVRYGVPGTHEIVPVMGVAEPVMLAETIVKDMIRRRIANGCQ